MTVDRRLLPARPDLAAAHLAGQVEAERFVEGRVMRVADPLVPMRRRPSSDAPLETELLLGEVFTVYEATDEGWSWGQAAVDSYVGWVPSDSLSAALPEPTHAVAVLRTFVYPGPNMKLPPRTSLSLGCGVVVVGIDGQFATLAAGGGSVFADHLAPLGSIVADPVSVAERFLEVPYLWGGRSSLGIDCSGLVQLSLAAAGIAAPRDSDLQEAGLGRPVPPDEALRRGDLVFWKGHVGVIAGPDMLIHASGHHMRVVREPFAAACERIREGGGGEVRPRRLG